MKKIVWLVGTVISMNAAVGMVNTSDVYNSQKYGNQNSGSSTNNRTERIPGNQLPIQKTVDKSTTEDWIKFTKGVGLDSQKKLLSNLEGIIETDFSGHGVVIESRSPKLKMCLGIQDITSLRESLDKRALKDVSNNTSKKKLVFLINNVLLPCDKPYISKKVEYNCISNVYQKSDVISYTCSNSNQTPPEWLLRGHSNSENNDELELLEPSWCSRFCDACSNLIQRMEACLRPQTSLNSGLIEAEQSGYESLI